MRKLKTTVAALAVMMMCCMSALAQKQFTLEDLNFGGKNYANMVPQNRTLRQFILHFLKSAGLRHYKSLTMALLSNTSASYISLLTCG